MLEAYGTHFDHWAHEEADVRTNGLPERVIAELTAAGHTYEEDGALWFRSTAFGDDKDRVLRKSDGELTYFGVDIAFQNASTRDAIDTAFAGFAREQPDALFIAADSFFAGRAVQLAMLSMRERLPASFTTRPMVQAGLLMSYGVDIIDTFRQVGVYTGTILKGTRPADLPVQQSTKLQLVFNLQTSKALVLEIPPMLLARADEVIE